MTNEKIEVDPAHRDPVSKEPASHPIGVGIGAASGAASGLAVGLAVGPAGAILGAAMGAVAGGIAGKVIAEGLNPSVEDTYWREHFSSRPYVEAGKSYDVYRPAYQFGWESRNRYRGETWETAEAKLEREWKEAHDKASNLAWENGARSATRDAWDRMLPERHEDR